MGQALYRKYRSKSLDEIVGQEHITTTLANALKKGNISHAYLFTGPRGVGKTSIARILAHEVNGLPYDEDKTHLDVIEIDAASNRRIDEIRELREKVHNAPTSAKYKVYIIDEVHMLTKEAFNALLKTLEEPPEHVIFILATTEAHKVPETIISRTQRFSFKPIPDDVAVTHLKSIAKEERLAIDDEALELIAEHGSGSFRDSISLLDQVRFNADKITATDVRGILGIAPHEAINKLIAAIEQGEVKSLLNQLTALQQAGYQAPQISRQLSAALREKLLGTKSATHGQELAVLLQQLINVPASHNPAALLELVLLESTLRNSNSAATDSKPAVRLDIPEESLPSPAQAPTQTEPVTKKKGAGGTGKWDETSWPQILQALKRNHNALYGIARMAVPKYEDNTLTLYFAFPFHQKRLEEGKNKQLVQELIQEYVGTAISLKCIVDKQVAASQPEAAEPAVDSDPLETISNIFGPSEVLES
jgi:DNA polymerase-3 subunit gamma/tau